MKPLDPGLFQYLGWNTQGDLGPWTFYTTKRGDLVFFPKAPPLVPPTPDQTYQRNRFKLVANLWKALRPETREAWESATIAANLRIHGYNLFVYYILTRDRLAIRTVERNSHVQLLDPENL